MAEFSSEVAWRCFVVSITSAIIIVVSGRCWPATTIATQQFRRGYVDDSGAGGEDDATVPHRSPT